MSAEITVPPAELRDHAAAIRSQVDQTTSEFNAMRTRLAQLQTAFRGQAAAAFETHWNDWHTHATGLIQALEGLGQFLTTTADVVEQVDSDLARRLNS